MCLCVCEYVRERGGERGGSFGPIRFWGIVFCI